MKRNERGMTLLEVMVAMVILAIVVLHMSIVPLMSLDGIRRSQGAARATAAARDQAEKMQNFLARSSANFPGYDSLYTLYQNPPGRLDSIKTVDGVVFTTTLMQKRPGVVDSGVATVTVRCSSQVGAKYQTYVYQTDLAKRDTLPFFEP